jgi:predicted nucleotidyltransferase
VSLALADFQRHLLELFPNDIQQIVLYGSYARGDWREESDVDVLVVTKWKEERLPDGTYLAWFGDPRWKQVIDAASDVLIERGAYVSPLVMSEARYAARKDSVLRDIEREGQTLWKNRQT